MYHIELEPESSTPLYLQLATAIILLIKSGDIKPGEKLPPIRNFSQSLKVNNVTIVNAYKYLESKKIVHSKVGSGTYVSLANMDEPAPLFLENKIHSLSKYEELGDNVINFANTNFSADMFPLNKFKEIFNEIFDRDKGNAFTFQDSQGYQPLREVLSGYMENLGIRAASDKILVTSGAQQSIDIISKVMLEQGDVVFIEKPTYNGALAAFLSRGAHIIGIDMESDGMDISILEKQLKIYSPKFIYLMSYYQTPTCISYSIQKKRQILELVNKYDTYIIEEDNISEFNYSAEKSVPLKALDYKNRVVYIKSFSKILMPGLRLGCMVLPKKIMQRVLTVKYMTDISSSGFMQRALDLYMRSPDWNNNISKIKETFKERHDIMAFSIDRYLGKKVLYTKPNGGISFWLKLNAKNPDTEAICGQLMEQGVVVTPGSLFAYDCAPLPFLRLSFSSVNREKIEKGIFEIGKVL